MSKLTLFFNLIRASLKRLKSYILHILVAVLILLSICSAAGIFISDKVYKEKSFTLVQIVYYLPEDDDMRYNLLALGMLEEMKSIEETAVLTRVSNIDEGYRMLESKEALFFVIVPENFFSGIMDSTNTPLDIIINDPSSAASHIANELFLSYGTYLGIAQAGIYSALDTARANNISSEQISDIQTRVNIIYLDRALNKDGYILVNNATNEGKLTLIQHYIAVAVMLSLIFMTFIISPLIQGYNSGVKKRLHSYRINNIHIFICNILITICALYIAFIPCYGAISIIYKNIYPAGLIHILPALLILAIIINIINILCHNTIVNHMTLLAVTLILTYIGGGILSSALLPKIIQQLSAFMPGAYIIKAFGHALFGI